MGIMASGVVDQDPSHCLRHHAEEVLAALPVKWLTLEHPKICFVYKGSGLERVVRTLSPHVGVSNLP